MTGSWGHHIILADENSRSRISLSRELMRNGLEVTALEENGQILPRMNRKRADLVLVEARSVKPGGVSTIRDLLHRSDVPIILITSPCGPADRIHWLEMGAADCIAKPVKVRELTVRIKNILRRGKPQSRNGAGNNEGARHPLEFASFVLDCAGRSLRHRGSGEIPLTRGEFDLLEALVKVRGRVLSRDQLVQVISTRVREAKPRTVDVLISRLRKKMERDPKKPKILCTAFQQGYFLSLEEA